MPLGILRFFRSGGMNVTGLPGISFVASSICSCTSLCPQAKLGVGNAWTWLCARVATPCRDDRKHLHFFGDCSLFLFAAIASSWDYI
jgi:hypothetical protein